MADLTSKANKKPPVAKPAGPEEAPPQHSETLYAIGDLFTAKERPGFWLLAEVGPGRLGLIDLATARRLYHPVSIAQYAPDRIRAEKISEAFHGLTWQRVMQVGKLAELVPAKKNPQAGGNPPPGPNTRPPAT